ncbi:MAG: DUF5666 domain-containing protein [Spirochaetota bacterium]|nr:DUF5666 domain-containing protein [Spirochaetota bacterium]
MKKIIPGLLAVVILAFAAQGILASSDDYRDRDYKRKRYYDKFYGNIEKLPKKGLNGLWVIDGRKVRVDNDTRIEEKHGPIEVGAYVEVKGQEKNGEFLADKIEVERQRRDRRRR